MSVWDTHELAVMAPQCLFSCEVLAIISLVTVAVLLDPARVSAAKSAEGHRAADDPVFQLFTRYWE